jgi:DNA-nicking Smr family endonuclease
VTKRDPKSGGGFADLFGDDGATKRVASKQRPPKRPSPGRRRPADAASGTEPDDDAQDEDTFRGDVARSDFTDLRMGRTRPETRVDLHGLDRDQARAALRKAFGVAAAAGRRCVLVIHGKGRGSPTPEDTLKRALPRWLRTPPLDAWVRGFAPAQPRDGGEGATYVLLRGGDRGRR